MGWFAKSDVKRKAAKAPRSESDQKAIVDGLVRRVKRLHHSVLEKDVLKGVLAMRARAAAERSTWPDARERERAFREASPSYAEAVTGSDRFPSHTRQITLDSLRWCVPLTTPDDHESVERAIKHQDFPYRVITQTREVALGGLMIDIGANVGRMSIPRVVLGDVTAVYCAEPDPINYECLVRNVRDNQLSGLVLPDRLAIGSEKGIVRLERGKSAGGHRVIDAHTRPRREVIEVESLPLDEWVARVGIDLGQLVFVKMDAQGSEVHVLRGAERVLACKHVAWQIEVDLQALELRRFAPADLFDLLTRHFSHFVDLGRSARGERVRPIGELADALSYVSGGSDGRTDVLVFTMESLGSDARATDESDGPDG